MSALLPHLRAGVRSLRRTPRVALGVVLTLALGIGLASATGVVARAIAFAGLPVRDAERVVVLWGTDRSGLMTHLALPPTAVPALAAAMRGVAEVAAADWNGASPWVFRAPTGGAGGDGPPLRLRGTLAGGTYFHVLGARPVIGRALRPEDDVIGAPRVLVLTHAAWRTHFGGDPRVIGRALWSVEHGAAYTIVGVMPPGLDFPRGVDFWTAFAPTAAVNGSLAGASAWVHVAARLAPDATPERARDALTTFYGTLRDPVVGDMYVGARATVRTLPALVTGDVRPAFTALTAAAAVVLLVTCGNVAGLLLVRAGRRRRERAVRAAIGADRRRLVDALLAEHAVLALAGGAAGAGVAAALVRAFAALAPAELPRLADLAVDGRVLAAAAAVTGLVVLAVGVGPALAASGVAPATVLGGARDSAGGRADDVRARRLLVGAQVALALVVLAGASLVGRSLARLTALDLGMPAVDRLAFVELVPPESRAHDDSAANARANARWAATFDGVMARVRVTPGIIAVAPVVRTPFSGATGWDGVLAAEGGAAPDSAHLPFLNMELTDADYLRATGVPLLRGRWFSDADRADAPRVVALSARAARQLFPGQDAVGRRVYLGGAGGERATVVGVVGDTRYREFHEPRPTAYFAYRQSPQSPTVLAVRTQGEPALAGGAVRRAAAGVDPAVLVSAAGTMRTLIAAPLARPRLLAAVLGAYAVVVVALAVGGLYAVAAGSVAARRREFGVRSAVGATPAALAALVVGEGLRVAGLGAAVGLAAALAGGRLLATSLYDVRPTDAVTLGLATVTLLGVCAAAVVVPARRAAHADPARVLRAE